VPAALAISAFAPWAITPLLMLGGLYLCFEGAEKVLESVAPHEAEAAAAEEIVEAATFEKEKVAGAIATYFILSGEIMAITLASIASAPFWQQALVLALVGVGLTVLVYGAVALIVKADDLGVRLAQEKYNAVTRAIGRGLVMGMPVFLRLLSLVGTAAMIWVGGGILLHGLEQFGLTGPAHLVHAAEGAVIGLVGPLGGFTGWAVSAVASGILGLAVGAALVPLAGLFHKKA